MTAKVENGDIVCCVVCAIVFSLSNSLGGTWSFQGSYAVKGFRKRKQEGTYKTTDDEPTVFPKDGRRVCLNAA
jgi:hypothetical protein